MSLNLCSDSALKAFDTPQITRDDLIADFAAGIKEKKLWKIGLELEQFAFNATDGQPLPYDGTPSIRMLLERFAAKYGWEIVAEAGNPVALKKGGDSLTLEPGGQVEYSGAPFSSLQEANAEMDRFFRDLDDVATECGIGFLRRGLHPEWAREEISWMPKPRYVIMRDYMQKKGKHGLDMMLRSCGAQINLDYGSEADMVKKFRVALAFQPAVIALMANSAMLDGRDTGYQSFRSFVWTETDPDRCGDLGFVFSEDMGFESYVEYALDVPMYFIRRDGKYINAAGLSFRDFMEGKLPGHEGCFPDMDDWQDHLTTLFPEVRLKRYLELRGADSNSAEKVKAMAALWVGILYDEKTLAAAHEAVMQRSARDFAALRLAAAKDGLYNEAVNVSAREVLDFAADGLSRIAPEALPLLEPFREKLV
ncbi:MAG: glutamate--cysteine ligase [Micavibrio sp.]|nr:MAG: glutamate--cysteine ligase [Micavibrio sp.]